MTLSRRYHELERNLPRARALAERELGFPVPACLVWAGPEPGKLHLVRGLKEAGHLSACWGRPLVPGEGVGGASSWPESLNIRLGLTSLQERLCSSGASAASYAVVLAADVLPGEGAFAQVHEKMGRGEHDACLFHWENSCCHSGAWHTNFFAVRLDRPECWPPLSCPGHPDALERQWGLGLEAKRELRLFCTGRRRFGHAHESEGLPPFPERTNPLGGAAPLYLRGRPTWKWAARVLTPWRWTWPKWLSRSTPSPSR